MQHMDSKSIIANYLCTLDRAAKESQSKFVYTRVYLKSRMDLIYLAAMSVKTANTKDVLHLWFDKLFDIDTSTFDTPYISDESTWLLDNLLLEVEQFLDDDSVQLLKECISSNKMLVIRYTYSPNIEHISIKPTEISKYIALLFNLEKESLYKKYALLEESTYIDLEDLLLSSYICYMCFSVIFYRKYCGNIKILQVYPYTFEGIVPNPVTVSLESITSLETKYFLGNVYRLVSVGSLQTKIWNISLIIQQ